MFTGGSLLYGATGRTDLVGPKSTLELVPDRLDEVPQGEVWVCCDSGYRASVAASICDHPGHQIVLINDDYGNAGAAGLEDERPTAGTSAIKVAGVDAR